MAEMARFKRKEDDPYAGTFVGQVRDSAGKIRSAYKEGGVPGAIGIGIRQALPVAGAFARDVTNPRPVREPSQRIVEGGMSALRTAATGDVQPAGSNRAAQAEFTAGGGASVPVDTPVARPSSLSRLGPNTGFIRNEETGESVGMVGGGRTVMYDADGNQIEQMSQGFRPLATAQPQPAQQASPYDVSFTAGTPQTERDAFMRQPGRPGTRRRSFGASQGSAPQSQMQPLEVPELNTFTDVMKYKAQTATRGLNNESFAKAAEAQNAARRTSAMEEDYGARAAQARASTETAQITNDLRNRLVNAESPIERQRIERQLKLSQGMNPDGSAMSQQDMANLEMDVVGEYTSAMEVIPRNERPSVEEWARQNAPGASALLYGESGGGDLTAVGQAFEALSPEQQASVDERFPPDSGATPAQIMEYIQSLKQ